MKVTYTGKLEKLLPAQHKKIEAAFSKLGKHLDRRGEKEARVILTSERHLHHAEITVNWHDKPIVVTGSDAELFTAILKAVEKLEKQVLKLQAKWRDTKRTAPKGKAAKLAPKTAFSPAAREVDEEEAPEAEPESPQPRVFRVNSVGRRKPMTVEEAVLEMNSSRQYFIYRDAETDKVSVLLRRNDGNFDLVES